MALMAGLDAGVGVARFFDGCPTADGCPYYRWMSLLQMDVMVQSSELAGCQRSR